MQTAQIIGYPLLLISALELFLGFLLLKQNSRNSRVNKATAACAFAAAVWSLSAGLMYVRLSLGLDYLPFARLSWVGWFTVPTALQTVFYLKDEQSRKARMVGMVLYPFWTAVVGLCLFTNIIVTPGFIPLPYTNSPGPLETPARLIGSITAFWLIYEIARLRREVTGYRRAQLDYYLYGTIIFGTGGAVIGGLLQVFTGRGLEPSLSAYFSLPWVLMIFYAITRHRLFDIRFFVSRTLIILLLSFCVSALQFVLFKFLEPVIGPVASIFLSVLVLGLLFFGTPLSRNVQQWMNDLVLKGRYQYQQMLKESTSAMAGILEREDLLRFIVSTVQSGLGVREVLLFLRTADGSFSARRFWGGGRDLPDGSILPDNVAACLSATNKPIIADELVAGPPGTDAGLQETVKRMGAEIVLPLISKGSLLAALTLSERSNGEPYLQGDIEALQTLASQAAVAIENTRLFDEAVQARALQKESENIFRTLAETTAAAIFIIRYDRILYVNKSGARISGYGSEELLAMNPMALIHPDDRQKVTERVRSFMDGLPVPHENEFRFVTKEGEQRWLVTSTAAIDLQSGPAILSTMVDVTDLKRAEEARAHFYRESMKLYQEKIVEQERFHTILANAKEGFWITDQENRFLFVNDAYLRLMGWDRDELMQKSIGDLDVLENHELVEQHTSRIKERGYEIFETQHRRKDGTPVDLEVSVTFYAPEGILFSFFRDIRERKQAEKALRQSEERFRQVADNVQEWIWEVNTEGKYTYASPVIESLLGYKPEDVVGKHFFYDFFVPEEREQLKRDALQVFAARSSFHEFTNRNVHKDGHEVILSTSGAPVLDEAGNLLGYRGADFDITRRLRMENERNRFYEESVSHYQALLDEQHRHQEEKEKILKDMHDGIGGITTNIHLLAELAQQSSDLAAVKQSLATISTLSRDNLLEIRSFIQSLDVRELSWQSITAELRNLGNTMVASHGIAFSFEAKSDAGAGEPTSIASMNLFRIYKESLSNIVKHSKATAVDVRFSVEKRRVSFDIRDNGIGLAGKQGSGRGLANMRTRARELGGSLEITSENGTRVFLSFPLS